MTVISAPVLLPFVGHRREMDDGLLPMVHDKCGSSSVANTTSTEPSDAWQWEGHHISLLLSLSSFPGGGGVGSFSWARSVWSS